MTTSLGERATFVHAVADAFDSAGVDYAFLHNVHGDDLSDSDLDVVVSRPSLAAVDAVARSGALGRLVQRLDYDVPWCRYYVLDTGSGERRFRQLDVSCDPFGIGRYGLALTHALDEREVVDGLRVPACGQRFVYLATKRAEKGIRDDRDAHQLRQAWAACPEAGTVALRRTFGPDGGPAATAMQAGDIQRALGLVGDALGRQRRSPARFARRMAHSGARFMARGARPTGLVVTLAGPDGTGKTTLAAGLEAEAAGVFRRTARLHLTPGLLPPPGRVLGRAPGDTSQPHRRPPSGSLGSVARAAYLALDTVVGWPLRVYPAKARSTLVVLERGWSDLRVDPRRYRLSGAGRLVAALDRVLPKADLRLLLLDDPSAIHDRKPELPLDEIQRQLASWRSLGGSEEIAESSIDETRARALSVVTATLARRVGDLSAFPTALRALGPPALGGARYAVVSAGGRPRWLLPVGGPGPVGSRLYRPAGARRRLGVTAMNLAHRAGVPGTATIALDTGLGLGPEIAATLGLPSVRLAALLPTDPSRSERVVLSVLDGSNAVIAVAKAAPSGDGELANELAALLALERVPTLVLRPPRVLGWFTWQGIDVILQEALEIRGRSDRAPGHGEVAALRELASMPAEVMAGISGEGAVLAHGDFCAWNTSRGNGRLAVWDWEWAHAGAPLEDLFHWHTQLLVHFGRGSEDGLLRMALAPSGAQREQFAVLGASAGEAPAGLAASLRHGLARISPDASGREREIRRALLARLGGRW